jgi:hypothetical protein
MKKRAFLIHGWEGRPEEGWQSWLKKELEDRGFTVIVPAMPDTKNPHMDKWVPFLVEVVDIPTENDYFVGHSLGCITILRYLEGLKEGEKVGGVVLVAGFTDDLGYKELSSFFQTPIDFPKVNKHCKSFVAIHSDDDQYVALSYGDIFKEKLGAKLIIAHNMKHFAGDDNILELPVALEAILGISKP